MVMIVPSGAKRKQNRKHPHELVSVLEYTCSFTIHKDHPSWYSWSKDGEAATTSDQATQACSPPPAQCKSQRLSPPLLRQCWTSQWRPYPQRNKNYTGQNTRHKSGPIRHFSMQKSVKSQQTACRTGERVGQGQKIQGANLMSLGDGTENKI